MAMRRLIFETGRCLRETGQALEHLGLRVQKSDIFKQNFSRHRNVMGIYDKQPDIAVDVFVAPSASVVGEVSVASSSSVWYGAVLRGDVNEISVGGMTSIQDGAVVTVSQHNDLGFPASTYIGHYVAVGPGASLHSCTVEDGAVIGRGAVISEGALVEKNAQVANGAVVGAGARVPAGQVFAGNPATYVRDLTEDEIGANKAACKEFHNSAAEHAHEFLPTGTAYLDAEKIQA
jgi:carbonic anhydrase/acetyltransferase-like protein (isoleucine patch superfamily)